MASVGHEESVEVPGASPGTASAVRPGWQLRFEQSRAGKRVVSVVIVMFLLLGVIWNLPDSPIARALQTVPAPVAAPVGLDQYWGMYGTPDTRIETVEVRVSMADGTTRVWRMEPGQPGVGWWDRWILLRRSVVHDAAVRPELAQWVVRRVSTPADRPQRVAVYLRTENLSPPGQPASGRAPAAKLLYQESLGPAR